MKIGLVELYATGGVKTFVDGLQKALEERGHDVTLISARNLRLIKNFEIIHSTGASIRMLRYLNDINRKKSILTIHGNFRKEFRNPVLKIAFEKAIKKFGKITVPCNFLKNELKIDAEAIPNGIFLPKNITARTNHKIILSCTNFDIRHKCIGMWDLADIVKDMDVKLLVCGFGKYEHAFKKYLIKSNINNVEMLGFRSDLTSLIASSEIIAHLSFLDNFPYFLLESMAYGKPIISNNIGGVPEMLGDSGIVARSQEEYKQELEKMLSDSALRNRLSSKARKRARLFAWKNVAKQFEALYEL